MPPEIRRLADAFLRTRRRSRWPRRPRRRPPSTQASSSCERWTSARRCAA
jgi:hypothetical protein